MSTEQRDVDLRDLEGRVDALHKARKTLFQRLAELEEENAELRKLVQRLEAQAGGRDE